MGGGGESRQKEEVTKKIKVQGEAEDEVEEWRRRWGGQVVNFRAGICEAAEPPVSAGRLQDFHTEIDSLTLADTLIEGGVGGVAA